MNGKNNEYIAKILKEKLEENDQLKNLLNQLENKKNIEVYRVFFCKIQKDLIGNECEK